MGWKVPGRVQNGAIGQFRALLDTLRSICATLYPRRALRTTQLTTAIRQAMTSRCRLYSALATENTAHLTHIIWQIHLNRLLD